MKEKALLILKWMGTCLLYLLLVSIVSSVLEEIVAPSRASLDAYLRKGVSNFIALFLLINDVSMALALLLLRKGYDLLGVPEAQENRRWSWGKIGLCAVVVGALIQATSIFIGMLYFWGSERGVTETLFFSLSPFFYFLTACLFAPLLEELFFRRLLDRLMNRQSTLSYALLSGISFGLFHIQPYNSLSFTIFAVLETGTAGFLFAILYRKSGTLSMPILAHSSMNLFAFLLARVL